MDNISVAIRVRPLVQRELSKDADHHWEVNENTIYQIENGLAVPSNSINPTTFVFDKVYSGSDTTESIYDQFAKPLVLKAMEGFNGTIFAYGQTGTGKTFTMMGESENPGVTPRAINDMFELVHLAPDREFLIRVSYMEIYNEVITDLLKADGSNLKVRNNEKNDIFVENLSEVPITSPGDALICLQSGEHRRRFGVTNMNEKSSRSHTIFRVIIESKLRNPDDSCYEDGAVNVSQLNLVDLAGSERAANTGAQGTRLKESGYINKSLLSLGTVISKLSSAGDERAFIPYRDSKLTRILQNSLGGNAKTSVIATVSAAAGEETFSTLKFASRAKTIKNKPTVNEVLDGDTMIRRYRKEINMLKQQIDEMNDFSKVRTLMTENEKMEQRLEENEKMRREQQLKIIGLQKMIISASEQTINLKRKGTAKVARRETWCPGKLKRSLAAASLLDTIADEDFEDDDVTQPLFRERKSDFLNQLDREERRSCEELKRRRSNGEGSAAIVKYRRSYQAGVAVELRVDQSCQTDIYEETVESKEEQEADQERHLSDKIKNLSDENAELMGIIERLTHRLEELETHNSKDEISDAEETRSSTLVATRRRKGAVVSPFSERAPAKKRQMDADYNDSFTSKGPSPELATPSKCDLKEDLSLVNFVVTEKDFEIEDLQVQLKEAQSLIKSLEDSKAELSQKIIDMESVESSRMEAIHDSSDHQEDSSCNDATKIKELETALDDLKYKMEELEIEKEALKEREQVQGSHLELLAKENSDLQREARNLADKNNEHSADGSENEVEDLNAQLSVLQRNLVDAQQELEDEKVVRGRLEVSELENIQLKEEVENLKSKNEELREVIDYKLVLLDGKEQEMQGYVQQITELNSKLFDLESDNKILIEKSEVCNIESDKLDDDGGKSELESEELQKLRLRLEEFDEIKEKFEVETRSNEALIKEKEETDAELYHLRKEVEDVRSKAVWLDRVDEKDLSRIVDSKNNGFENHSVPNEEAEQLKSKLETLENLIEGLREELSLKDSLLQETIDKKNEEFENMKSKLAEIEELNRNTVQDVSIGSHAQNEEREITRSTSAELMNVEDDPFQVAGSERSAHEDEDSCQQGELEEIKTEVARLEEIIRNLREEITARDCVNQIFLSRDENEIIEDSEEIVELKRKLAESEQRNEELCKESAAKDEQIDVKLSRKERTDMEDVVLRMTELEELNEKLKQEVRAKDALIQQQDEERYKETAVEEEEGVKMEASDGVLFSEFKDSNATEEDNEVMLLRTKLEDMRSKLIEMEDRNEMMEKQREEEENTLREKEENDRVGMSLKDELAEIDSLQNVDESTNGYIEDLTMKILELEEAKEDLLSKLSKTSSLEEEKYALIEQMTSKETEIESLENRIAELAAKIDQLETELSASKAVTFEKPSNQREYSMDESSLQRADFDDLKCKEVDHQLNLAEMQRKTEDLNMIISQLREEIASGKASLMESSRLSPVMIDSSGNMRVNLEELEKANGELSSVAAYTDSLLSERVMTEDRLNKAEEDVVKSLSENVGSINETLDSSTESEDVTALNSEFQVAAVEVSEFENLDVEMTEEMRTKDGILKENIVSNQELPSRFMAKEELIEGEDSVRRNEEIEDIEARSLEIEFENESLRQISIEKDTLIAKRIEIESLKNSLDELEKANELLLQEIDVKNALLKEQDENIAKLSEFETDKEDLLQEVDVKNSLLKEQDEKILKIAKLETDKEDLLQEVDVKNSLLKEQDEKILKIAKLETDNEDLLQEVYVKNSLLKEQDEKILKIAELETAKENFLQEIDVKNALLKEQDDKILKLAELETAEINLLQEIDVRNVLLKEQDEKMAMLMELETDKENLLQEIEVKDALLKEQDGKVTMLAELETDKENLLQEIEVKNALLKEQDEKVTRLGELEAANDKLLEELESKCSLLNAKEIEAENFTSLKEVEDVRIQLAELEAKNNELSKEVDAKSSLLEEQDEEMRKCIKIERAEELRSKFMELEDSNEELVNEVAMMKNLLKEQEDVEEMKMKIRKLEEENKALTEELSVKSSLMETKMEDLNLKECLEEKLTKSEARNEELCKEITSMSVLIKEQEEEARRCIRVERFEELRLKLVELEAANDKLRVEISRREDLIKEQSDLEDVNRKLVTVNKELRADIEKNCALLKERDEDWERAATNILKEQNEFKDIEKKLHQLEVENGDLREEINAKCSLLEEKELKMQRYVEKEVVDELKEELRELESTKAVLIDKYRLKCEQLEESKSEVERCVRMERYEKVSLELSDVKERNAELREELSAKDNLLEEQKSMESFRYEITVLEEAREASKQELAKKDEHLFLLKSEIEEIKGKLEDVKNDKEIKDENKLRNEIESMKIEIKDLQAKLKESEYQVKECERLLDEGDQEVYELNKELSDLQKQVEKDKKAAVEEIAQVKTRYSQNETIAALMEKLEKVKKDNSGGVCIGVSLEKENRKLKEKLEKSEHARVSYEEYQERRVAGLKSELKKLREITNEQASTSELEQARLRSISDNATLITLKSDNSNLERECGKLRVKVEDLTKKNNGLAYEKYNIESRLDSLRSECSHLKRGIRGTTCDIETQTEFSRKMSVKCSDEKETDQENKRDGIMLTDSHLYQFKEKKEEPGQCAQQ